MTNTRPTLIESRQSIISFAKDLPNLCSLIGLACTVMAIYYSIIGNYYAAMIGMVWAVAFDWADGLIARTMKERTGDESSFGGQLDVLIDILSYGAAPAILLLSVGSFSPFYLVGAFLMLAASALRLSYFSTFGLTDDSKYTGLALDNNSLAIVFIFLFEQWLSAGAFAVFLYVSCVCLAILNISSIKTPKLSGSPKMVYCLAAYTITITLIYGWKMI